MGMYDTVKHDGQCWNCNHPIHSWQSKSGECLLRELDAISLMRQDELSQIEIHETCTHCNKWNSVIVKRQDALREKRETSHWNYRLIHRVFPGGKEDLSVYEVYYTDGKPEACTVDPVYPHGETLDEFQQDFERYKRALFEPILQYDEFSESDEFQEW